MVLSVNFVGGTVHKNVNANQHLRQLLTHWCVAYDVQSRKECSMGSTADKIKGGTNEAVGKAKQGIGEATGSDRLQGEGVMQEVKGKGQKAVGEAKDAAKDAANRAAAAANNNL
jgi:uncharacterized protein YjbJ (UPF0337 family)